MPLRVCTLVSASDSQLDYGGRRGHERMKMMSMQEPPCSRHDVVVLLEETIVTAQASCGSGAQPSLAEILAASTEVLAAHAMDVDVLTTEVLRLAADPRGGKDWRGKVDRMRRACAGDLPFLEPMDVESTKETVFEDGVLDHSEVLRSEDETFLIMLNSRDDYAQQADAQQVSQSTDQAIVLDLLDAYHQRRRLLVAMRHLRRAAAKAANWRKGVAVAVERGRRLQRSSFGHWCALRCFCTVSHDRWGWSLPCLTEGADGTKSGSSLDRHGQALRVLGHHRSSIVLRGGLRRWHTATHLWRATPAMTSLESAAMHWSRRALQGVLVVLAHRAAAALRVRIGQRRTLARRAAGMVGGWKGRARLSKYLRVCEETAAWFRRMRVQRRAVNLIHTVVHYRLHLQSTVTAMTPKPPQGSVSGAGRWRHVADVLMRAHDQHIVRSVLQSWAATTRRRLRNTAVVSHCLARCAHTRMRRIMMAWRGITALQKAVTAHDVASADAHAITRSMYKCVSKWRAVCTRKYTRALQCDWAERHYITRWTRRCFRHLRHQVKSTIARRKAASLRDGRQMVCAVRLWHRWSPLRRRLRALHCQRLLTLVRSVWVVWSDAAAQRRLLEQTVQSRHRHALTKRVWHAWVAFHLRTQRLTVASNRVRLQIHVSILRLRWAHWRRTYAQSCRLRLEVESRAAAKAKETRSHHFFAWRLYVCQEQIARRNRALKETSIKRLALRQLRHAAIAKCRYRMLARAVQQSSTKSALTRWWSTLRRTYRIHAFMSRRACMQPGRWRRRVLASTFTSWAAYIRAEAEERELVASRADLLRPHALANIAARRLLADVVVYKAWDQLRRYCDHRLTRHQLAARGGHASTQRLLKGAVVRWSFIGRRGRFRRFCITRMVSSGEVVNWQGWAAVRGRGHRWLAFCLLLRRVTLQACASSIWRSFVRVVREQRATILSMRRRTQARLLATIVAKWRSFIHQRLFIVAQRQYADHVYVHRRLRSTIMQLAHTAVSRPRRQEMCERADRRRGVRVMRRAVRQWRIVVEQGRVLAHAHGHRFFRAWTRLRVGMVTRVMNTRRLIAAAEHDELSRRALGLSRWKTFCDDSRAAARRKQALKAALTEAVRRNEAVMSTLRCRVAVARFKTYTMARTSLRSAICRSRNKILSRLISDVLHAWRESVTRVKAFRRRVYRLRRMATLLEKQQRRVKILNPRIGWGNWWDAIREERSAEAVADALRLRTAVMKLVGWRKSAPFRAAVNVRQVTIGVYKDTCTLRTAFASLQAAAEEFRRYRARKSAAGQAMVVRSARSVLHRMRAFATASRGHRAVQAALRIRRLHKALRMCHAHTARRQRLHQLRVAVEAAVHTHTLTRALASMSLAHRLGYARRYWRRSVMVAILTRLKVIAQYHASQRMAMRVLMLVAERAEVRMALQRWSHAAATHRVQEHMLRAWCDHVSELCAIRLATADSQFTRSALRRLRAALDRMKKRRTVLSAAQGALRRYVARHALGLWSERAATGRMLKEAELVWSRKCLRQGLTGLRAAKGRALEERRRIRIADRQHVTMILSGAFAWWWAGAVGCCRDERRVEPEKQVVKTQRDVESVGMVDAQ